MTIEFLIVAESGVLEQQALLLCESIRTFGGKYAGNTLTILQPRKEKPISLEGRSRFQAMGGQVVELSVVSPCPEYGPSYRIFACAEYETTASSDCIIFMDSDTVLLSEPDLDLQGTDVAVRPVDVQGMCTEGGDANEAYWRRLCQACDVDYERLPWVTTTVDRVRVRASYNAGLTVVKTKTGLFGKTADFFLRSLRTELVPWPERTTGFPAGHGMVSVEGGRFWGSSQACLSLAITALGLSVRTLSPALNFPLNFYYELLPEIRNGSIPEISHLHYHHIFRNDPRENPVFCGLPGLPAGAPAWLWSRLVEGTKGDEATNSGARVILVLGMHRSGTSTMARSLEVLGVDMGSNLLPGRPDNPKGYWEDAGFNVLNDELLETLGRSWSDPGCIKADVLTKLTEGVFFFRALELLRQRLRGKTCIGIKDPRFALLLPFWKKVFVAAGVSVSHVVAIRNPLSVVNSLMQRDSMSKAQAIWLWVAHYLEIAANTAGDPLVVLDYDELMAAPDPELARVAGVLGLSVDQEALKIFTAEFLDPALRHTRYSVAELAAEPTFDPLVVEMYESLRVHSLALSGLDADAWGRMTVKWRSSFSRFEGLLELIFVLTVEKRASAAHSAKQRLSHEALCAEIQSLGAELRSLSAEKEALESQSAGLVAKIHDHEANALALMAHNEGIEKRLKRIEASRGWRFWKKTTAILRMIRDALGFGRRPSV